MSDLEMNAKAIQDRISGLMSSKTPSSPRPDSRVSTLDSAQVMELQGQVERLQARLDAAEDESNRLRTRTEGAEREASSRIESLVAERDQHAARVSELEGASRTSERTVRDSTGAAASELEDAKSEKRAEEVVQSEPGSAPDDVWPDGGLRAWLVVFGVRCMVLLVFRRVC